MSGRIEAAIERRDLRQEALQIVAQLPKDKIEALTVLTHCRQLLEFLEGHNFVDKAEMIDRLYVVAGTAVG